MAIIVTKSEAQQLDEAIRKILFPNTCESNQRIMCVTFPTNGLYVAEGLVRYVLEKNTSNVDTETYFEQMRLKDYMDLKVTLDLQKNHTEKGGMTY